MTNLKFKNGHGGESSRYYTDLNYLIVKNQLSQNDTVFPFDIKFYLKSGNSWGYTKANGVIFKEDHFITFEDTTLKTHPKCKLCNINIDSIEKVTIRGPLKLNFPSYNDSRWHIEYRMGLTSNFVNQKTKKYIDNYFNLGFGTSLYYNKFNFSYCFNGATLLRVKEQFKNTAGDSIRKYANTFWKTNSPYSINIIKHNFDFGYEFKIDDKISLNPTFGIGLWHFSIKDSSNYKKNLNPIYDINLGLSMRRFVYITEYARFFYGIQGYFSYSNVNENFLSFGNPYWAVTINCGFKFVPRGLGAIGIISGLSNR